jgi:hypothetical protein
MNRITNVRLHMSSLQEYREVCAILSFLKITPPIRYAEYIFIYKEHATISDSTTWFNSHDNAFMETSDYIKRRGLNKCQFLLKRKKL